MNQQLNWAYIFDVNKHIKFVAPFQENKVDKCYYSLL